MRRCSKLLILEKMKIKSRMRYHLTLVRMAIIKKSTDNKCWRGCGEKGTLLHGSISWCSHCGKTVRRFLKKLKTELPYDPEIPLLGIYSGKTIIWKDTHTPVFIAALFITARQWEQLNVHWQMNGQRKYETYLQQNISQKEKDNAIWYHLYSCCCC